MKKYILSILFIMAVTCNLFSQQGRRHYHSDTTDSFFNFDALNFYTSEGTKSRVDIYVEVPFSKLDFKKSKNAGAKFASDFDLTVDIRDNSNKSAYFNVSKEEISANETGTEYLSNNSQVITKNVFLPPGDYTVHINLFEQSTKRSQEKIQLITVKDFTAKPLTISDIMVVSALTESNGKKFITPDVTRNAGLVDTFYLFFYTYDNSSILDNTNKEIPLDVTCRIFGPDKKEVYSSKQSVDRSKASGIQNQVIFSVPFSGYALGLYSIEVNAAAGTETSSAGSWFKNQNLDFPMDLANIDELIDQLQYIAKHEEVEYIKAGSTVQEKQKRFLEFWKAKDPTPLTKKNEVMMAYYQRLNYANQHFSTPYTKGWRSDMGMVYIIFGMPSNIDRHPYDMDTKPYEVWDYYEVNRQFIFVDNTGFGDYRLTTPIWDTFRR